MPTTGNLNAALTNGRWWFLKSGQQLGKSYSTSSNSMAQKNLSQSGWSS